MGTASTGVFACVAAIAIAVLPAIGAAQNAPANRPELKVGDKWTAERRDAFTKKLIFSEETVVTSVTPADVKVSINGSPGAMTPDLTGRDGPRLTAEPGYELLRFPMEVGKRWDFRTRWQLKQNGAKGGAQLDVEVKGMESVKVPAGEFDAYKLEASGFMSADSGRNWRATATYWYAPKAKAIVRFSWADGGNDYVTELVQVNLVP